MNRLPPHAPDAEQGVLGCIFLSPNEAMPECAARLVQESFYDLRHQKLFGLLVAMSDAREPIDLITVQSKLRDAGELESTGGLGYLNQLMDATPSAANLGYYIGIVAEKHQLRKVLHTCASATLAVYECENVPELLDEFGKEALAIGESGEQEDRPIKSIVGAAIDKIEYLHEHKGMLSGISTGFIDLDRMTTGLHGGEMIVIAARPSMGKTSLAMNIAEHVAVNLKLPVGVFSLEMTSDSLVMRMMCSRAEINLRDVLGGQIYERDFPRMHKAFADIASAPLFIDDTSALPILKLRARARKWKQRHGIRLLVIDYLQLIHASSKHKDNRQQEIAEISSGIKALAKELDIPVIILSQLNRELEKDKRKPRLSDLRESGAIEQDADLVGMLYKPVEDEGQTETVNLLIAKQRNGPTGDVPLTFFKSFTRFRSAAKVSQEDVPPVDCELL